LRAEVAQVRQVLPSRARREGNVAAHIFARQVPCFLPASSRVAEPTPEARQAVGLVGAAAQWFRTSSTPRNDGSDEMRENTITDTENKILDEVGRFLDWDPGREGIIQLFTERAPCDSCSDVIAQFSRAFPRVTLMVIDNNNNDLIPPAGL
jgi:filamentous hemagglutinin